MTWRVKKIALERKITQCGEGIEALKRYRVSLRNELDELQKQKPKA